MSVPIKGGALWSGNQQLATAKQLTSTTQGLINDLNDFQFSTISQVSTITALDWISTPVLYVSDLQAKNIDISGLVIDASGIFYAQYVSSSSAFFNITNVSIMQLQFKPTFTGNINVSFDLGLGQAIGGALAGLGAAVGGGLIAVGTGVGLAVQGAEQGIATIIAGRPQNFINNNVYETINFTSQLQVSTIGNDYPVYSTVFRTVSSIAPDQIPGKEIFTSTLFYPGQICIRSVSDPIQPITGDANINTSTIQSFGQWVPLEGLEPENIIANSISTNTISSGIVFAGTGIYDGMTVSSVGVASNISMNYDADILFNTGATNYARILGSLNDLYFQTDTSVIFTQPYTTTANASLALGVNGGESIFNVSSIFATGYLQANSAYISSLTAETLTVVSTINLTSTNVENITSSATAIINEAFIEQAYISTLSSFTFATGLGNPTGPFDINKFTTITSTSYVQVSSLTHNIMSYTMEQILQDQTAWNLNAYETPQGILYRLNPTNQQQWASTIMIFNDYQNPGGIELPVASQFSSIGFTGTFDVETQYNSGTPGYYAPFAVMQDWVPGSEYSTFSTFLQLSAPNPPVSPPVGTWRFTIGTSGWIENVVFGVAPYQTSNTSVFQITQDINDLTIKATDRLNFEAGEIWFDGTTNLTTTNVQTAESVFLFSQQANISTIYTSSIIACNVIVNARNPSGYGGGVDILYSKPSTVSYNAAPTQTTPLTMNFTTQTADFLNQYGLIAPFQGSNSFNYFNYTSWNMSVFNNNVAFSLGVPKVFVGDVQSASTYSARFYINNGIVSPTYALPIYRITSAGSNLLGTIPGGNYGLITTTDGVNWTLNNNVPNPQGNAGGVGATYCNIVNTVQTAVGTYETHTQNYQIQAPNTNLITQNFNLYADAIRVNSRVNGAAQSSGLPSFPIGIEQNVYIDSNMSFSNVGSLWQSDATNILSNITGTLYYDYNSWTVYITPSRFRTNNSEIVSWDVQPAVFSVGGGGFAWGYNRYIQVNADVGGPGSNANNWNWYLAIPANYITR